MRYVLGMAKSSLDLTGAKAQKLELDVLRLIYAVQHLRRGGSEAHGYLLVLRPELITRARTWLVKYQAADCVTCLWHSMSEAENAALLAEKASNVSGMLAGTAGEPVNGQSSADSGRALGELALFRLIQKHEPSVRAAPPTLAPPLSIRWDFFGVAVTP
jgi:hypothetical protein